MEGEHLGEDPDHAADGLGSLLIVASDDNNTNAGRLALLNCRLDLNPRGIEDACVCVYV